MADKGKVCPVCGEKYDNKIEVKNTTKKHHFRDNMETSICVDVNTIGATCSVYVHENGHNGLRVW